MAVDVKKYCYLLDPLFQVENIAGKPAVGGHIEVFHAGTDTPYITYQNFDGTHNPFKVPLNNDGRAVILAEPYYTYDVYCYDSFNNMICSRLNVQPQVGGDVSVSGFTEVWHDDTLSGEGTPQSPLTVIGGGGSGKTYSGIDPIVVNNDEDKISANTVPFGVQEPLYFVEDETATIIGISGNPSADAVNWVTAQGYLQRPDLIGYATTDFVESAVSGKYDTSAFSTISGAFLTALPEGSMNESAFGYSGGLITSYNGSAFKAGDEFPQSATDAIQVVTSNSGNWDDSYSAVTSNSASWNDVSGKLDESAFSSVSGDFQTTASMTAYQPAGDYLTTGDSSNFYTTANESGFITGVDLTPYQTTAGMTAYASKDDVSGLQSASVWNDAVNTVSSNSASWTGIEYTGVSPIVVDNATRSISADTWSVTFGSGLSAIDDTANSATTIVVTAQGGGSSWSEEYVDIPWRIWSTTTTTWQTIIDYANAHNGIPPKGICINQDNAIFYPVRFVTGQFNEILYQAIYHYAYDQTNGGVQNRIFSRRLTPDGWSQFTETLTDQADWNETGTGNWSYIRNKPHIPEIELDSSNQVSAIDGYTLAGGGGAATLPVSGSAGDNSAVYDLYDMKIEYNLPSVGGSEPEHAYVQADTASLTVYNSTDEDQSYSQTIIGPDYIHLENPADGYEEFYAGDVTNWKGTYETVSNNSAYWDRAYTAVDTNSANWEETYSAVSGMSAEWTSAFTTVDQSAGAWDSTYNTVYDNSASWGSTISVATGSI